MAAFLFTTDKHLITYISVSISQKWKKKTNLYARLLDSSKQILDYYKPISIQQWHLSMIKHKQAWRATSLENFDR